MSRVRQGGRICEGARCDCPVAGGPFAGTGAHKPGCPVGIEWARLRIAAGKAFPHDAETVLRATPSEPVEAPET